MQRATAIPKNPKISYHDQVRVYSNLDRNDSLKIDRVPVSSCPSSLIQILEALVILRRPGGINRICGNDESCVR